VLLVHGAFADGPGWHGVDRIAKMQRLGLPRTPVKTTQAPG
jgi:hypothetical protein